MVSYLCDKDNNKISSVPNIIHAVDNDIEFSQHLDVYFKDIDPTTV